MAAMMASPPSMAKTYILFIGPMFIGSIMNWALFGVVALQAYIYFRNCSGDAVWIRALVAITIILDVVQTIFATQLAWNILVLGYGDPSTILEIPRAAFSLPILGGLVSALVQLFCAWRIIILRKTTFTRCICALIVLITCFQCTCSFVIGIQWGILGVVRGAQHKIPVIAWLVSSSMCDIIIALAMTYVLYTAKTADMFLRTHTLIDKLIFQVVQSGAITAAGAIVDLILYVVYSKNYLHIGMVILLGKLYSNVLLANLNGRPKRGSYSDKISSGSSNNVHISTFRHVTTDMELKPRTDI